MSRLQNTCGMRHLAGGTVLAATAALAAPTARARQMRQIRTLKHRPGSRCAQQPPLPADARDPDIVRAHQAARLAARSAAARTRRDGHARAR
jgi:hypothetical protein